MATYNAILLSGLPGSGKSTLARKLSEELGWPVHSIGGLWREKWRTKFPTEEEQQKNPFPEYWASQPLEAQKAMNEKARKVVALGTVIGDFRYSICCKGLPALFVFVTADLEVRVQRALLLPANKGKTQEQMKAELLKRETEEVAVGKEQFAGKYENYDYRNPENYNTILNSGLLPIKEEVSTIRHLVCWG